MLCARVNIDVWPEKTGGFGPPAGWTFRREEFAHDLERTTAWKRHDGIKMSFLLFLRGLIGVLLVFAITTYVITQSLWTTLIQTVICAVLLQVGYFVAVLFLVWRSAGRPEAEETPAKNEILQNLPKDDQTGEVSRLPGVPRSGHP
jgi:exopolysaccharide production repressor protein